MKKGFTLIELLIVVAIIAILAAIAVPNFLEAQIRAKVSRVKNDQRSLATGLETYYVDNNTYPVSARAGRTPAGTDNYNYDLSNAQNPPGSASLRGIDSFATRNVIASPGTGIATLTTPISYITSYFSDPFADYKAATFGYYNDNQGWILFSPGPDTDQASFTDLSAPGGAAGTPLVETLYSSSIAQPSPMLLCSTHSLGGTTQACTYDSTNGTVSNGDVWRVKQ